MTLNNKYKNWKLSNNFFFFYFSLVKLENELAGSKKLLADATLKINTLENELKFEKDKLNVEIEKRKKLQVCYLLI